jgi:hypothetical protein
VAVPGPDSITAGKAPVFAGPTLDDLEGAFSTPPAAASNARASSSLTLATVGVHSRKQKILTYRKP